MGGGSWTDSPREFNRTRCLWLLLITLGEKLFWTSLCMSTGRDGKIHLEQGLHSEGDATRRPRLAKRGAMKTDIHKVPRTSGN